MLLVKNLIGSFFDPGQGQRGQIGKKDSTLMQFGIVTIHCTLIQYHLSKIDQVKFLTHVKVKFQPRSRSKEVKGQINKNCPKLMKLKMVTSGCILISNKCENLN